MPEVNKFVVLKVPGMVGSTPYIQTSVGGLIERCKVILRGNFPKADLRNPVEVDGKILAAEFHKLDNRDAEAGMRLLMFLMGEGYNAERVDISQSEHGDYVVACVYMLRKQ